MRRKGFLSRAVPLSILSSAALLIACGGGSKPPPPPPPGDQISTSEIGVIVSPQAGTGSLQGQSVKLRKLQTNAEFRVEVVSSDASGNVIDRKVVTADTQTPVSVKVKLSAKGGAITVSATADGYNKATKSFRYTNPNEVKNLNIELTPLPVKTQIVGIQQGLTITSSGQKYVRFAIFRDSSGLTKLAVGESEISKQSNDGEKLLDVAIPLSKLQSDVQSLRVQYRDFRPSNPEDYRNFPGEETVDGQKLVSFGFDYLSITDQNGNNPFATQSSQGLSAQQSDQEYYRILRYVDCNQINEMRDAGILQDMDPDRGGVQFTFYAFDRDQGGWVEAGEGVFVSKQINIFTDAVWDYIIQNGCVNDTPCSQDNPSTACVDVDGDGTPEDVSCSGNSVITDVSDICQNGSGWVVVSVTNPALEWKNLDYVVPGNSQVCCDVSLVDDLGNPVSGAYVYVDPTSNIEWTYGITDAEGKVTLCTVSYGNNPQGELWYYNPYTLEYKYYKTISFSGNCSLSVTVTNPYKCTVEGRVVDENDNPVRDAYVRVYDSSYTVYRWDYTDENGNYSISVPCGNNLLLNVNNHYVVYSFNVDGTQSGNETNDDGTIAQLEDYTLPNYPPEGYAYAWDYTVKPGESVNITVCAWDWEGDYPITYRVDTSNLQGSVNPDSGQIGFTEWCGDITYTAPNQVNQNQTNQKFDETINITFTDSAGKESTYSLTITVTTQNSPPVGYLYGSVSSDGTNYIYDIYAYFYDEDGDNINWSISNDCGATDANRNDTVRGSVQGWDYVSATFTTTTAKTCTFTLTLDDGTTTVTETLTLSYNNQTPDVYLSADPGTAVLAGTASVTVYASIYDDDDPATWTCTWSVNGVVDSSATSCYSYTLDLSNASVGDTFYVELCVTDPVNNTGCDFITISYVSAGDAEIIIQNK